MHKRMFQSNKTLAELQAFCLFDITVRRTKQNAAFVIEGSAKHAKYINEFVAKFATD